VNFNRQETKSKMDTSDVEDKPQRRVVCVVNMTRPVTAADMLTQLHKDFHI
jgi:hypothetical protein